jgi:hypothetical protein
MVGVGDQARDQVDEEIKGTAVPRMLDLAKPEFGLSKALETAVLPIIPSWEG